MKIETFEMERMQSTWENQVTCNLSESGVHALRIEEILDDIDLANIRLGYGHTNGSPELRQQIAAHYEGASPDNVLVTIGTAEANFLGAWKFAAAGADVVVMTPNYMQIWGAAQAFGSRVLPFPLKPCDGAWRPDLDALQEAVTERTSLIAVCNPNNPTGSVLTTDEMDAICRIADAFGVWILADEVYRGAELTDVETPSFWGRGDRVLVTSGLSKAYGLPGLRIGWILGQRSAVADLWRYKDYTTIGPSLLSDRLAQKALEPANATRILERNRRVLRDQYRFIEQWLADRTHLLEHIPPLAGAFVYPRYHAKVNSTGLTDRLRKQDSVLMVPGDHFRMDGYLRIGFSVDQETLGRGLVALETALVEMS